jgi:hypothetical protein
MKNARALLIAVFVVTGVLLLGGDVAQAAGGGGVGGGGFGGGGFHGGSINNPGPVTGGYGVPYGWGGGYLNYGGVTNPTPETTNPLGSGGGDTYQVYGPREPGAATDPPAQIKPRGTIAADDALDQGGPGDPLQGHLRDDWWEAGESAQGAAAEGPAVGTTVAKLPIGYKSGYVGNQQYAYRGGVFYAAADSGYEVIAPPIGATVSTIPGRAQLETVGGQQYFDLDGVYYQAFYSGSGLVYKVVEDPQS